MYLHRQLKIAIPKPNYQNNKYRRQRTKPVLKFEGCLPEREGKITTLSSLRLDDLNSFESPKKYLSSRKEISRQWR